MRIEPPSLDGIAPSTLQLPQGSWRTVLEYLVEHFVAIPREQWISRMQRGLVTDAHGVALDIESPYLVGQRVYYYREIIDEAAIPFLETVLYADAHLVVADKPHFLPVAPVGSYVHETLLSRLRKRLDNPHLVPLHRIDRGTAGLVMFSAHPKSRDAYHALFRNHQVVKRYEALACPLPAAVFPLRRSSRIVRGEPFLLSKEVAGPVNAETKIEIKETSNDVWRYELYPITGKKHQLRVHMAALGAPILNDDFYPTLQSRAIDDFSQPLQLLAQSLKFLDPISKTERQFESQLSLNSIGSNSAQHQGLAPASP